MSVTRVFLGIGIAILIALPAVTPTYFLHLLIQILILAFIYTAWSLMGRFGFVSFGHGAFLGVGAYVPALLWSYWDVTPWLGIAFRSALSRRSYWPSSSVIPAFAAGLSGTISHW